METDKMDTNSVMQAWAIYKDQVLGFPSQVISYLDVYATINILNLGVALNNVSGSAKCSTKVIDPSAPTVGRSYNTWFMQAYMLHVAVKWPVHWVRLFLTLMIMVTGGGTSVAMFTNSSAPWAGPAGTGTVPAVVLAFVIMFWLPDDMGPRGFRWLPRTIWNTVSGLQLTFGVANGIRAGLNANPNASAFTLILLAVISSVGGSIIAEFLNLLLLPRSSYKWPRFGPGPAALYAFWGAILHLGLTGRLPLIPAFTTTDTATAILTVVLVFLSLMFNGEPVMKATSQLLSFLGIRSIIAPTSAVVNMERMPWPLDLGLWGYSVTPFEYLDNLLDDVDENEDQGGEEEAAQKPAPASASSPAANGRRASVAASASSVKAVASAAGTKQSNTGAASPVPKAAGRSRSGSVARRRRELNSLGNWTMKA